MRIGNNIKFNMQGKSHGQRIYFSLSHIDEGIKISLDEVQREVDRRSSKNKDYASQRKERDILHIQEGIEDSLTTGQKIVGYFENEDFDSKAYEKFEEVYRPSHVDFVSKLKYGKDFDLAGSSFFSGRLSVAIVAGGAIAKQILKNYNIKIYSRLKSIYNIEDEDLDYAKIDFKRLEKLDPNLPLVDESKRGEILDLIERLRKEGDSVGGQIELFVDGIQAFGGPYFDRLQAYISRYLFSIPGSKAVEFGNGIESTLIKGSENNDPFIDRSGRTKTNKSGGINGGIANGMPVVVNLSIKPTSSISKKQRTLNFKTGQMVDLEIEGRHDPAFVLRVFPVAESLLALCLLDYISGQKKLSIRESIDLIDDNIMALYDKRVALVERLGREKAQAKKAVYDGQREDEIVERLVDKHPRLREDISTIYGDIFQLSRNRQDRIIKALNASYGLLGKSLGHSYSKEIHESLRKYSYELIEIREEELGDFLERDGLMGLNVTIPYKEKVIPYLDELTNEAKKIGAVNTIKFTGNKKIGYNTDYYGFKKMLLRKKIQVKGKDVLILGTGATSKTARAALEDMKARSIKFVSRTGNINYHNIYDQNPQILVNTTPVGMYPNNGDCLVDLDRFKRLEAVVDVVYNPINTRLVLEAKRRGLKATGGLSMLVYQAVKSFEIFTGQRINNRKAEKILDKLLNEKRNIILVGMPGAGKTSIARKLSKRLGKDHVDLDKAFIEAYGISPSQVIEKYGEEKFRDMESKIAKEYGSRTSLVISTGGGVVTRDENYYHLKQNGLVILIDRNLKKLSTKNRPLSQGGIQTLVDMKNKRNQAYQEFADMRVVNNRHFNRAMEEILRRLARGVNHLWY